MKIHNIRFGFATNSSSSHSIIFDPNYSNIRDSYEGDGFGWDFFTLRSKQAKDEYMKSMLVQNLDRDNFSNALISVILKGLNLGKMKTDHYGIDHQSLFYIPKEFGKDQISIDFFKDFRKYILKEGIVILGGNDNVDYDDEDTDEFNGHPLFDETKLVNLNGYKPESLNWICRKDGSWWTLYNRFSGDRIVLSFEDNPEPFTPKTPMLVDIKITDHCAKGCAYCFQGSTIHGEHMQKGDEYAIIANLAEAEVFEIAIGGGEPTQYPNFVKFVKMAADRGIIVNFTTRSIDWLENEKIANDIMATIGAFAFSIDEVTPEIDRIITIMKYRGYDLQKFNIQVVPAAISQYALERILKWCARNFIRVTLLGFKETGRGAKFKDIAINRNYDKFDESQFIEVIKELNKTHECPRLAIDTTLASRYQEVLEAEGIPAYLYHIEEGKYSAYIDAVAKKFGPSSYHLDNLIHYNISYGEDAIAKLFAQIEPTT